MTKIVPQKTRLDEIPLNDGMFALQEKGVLPPGIRQFRYGRASVLVCPPINNVGWYLAVSHPDRSVGLNELRRLANELFPAGTKFISNVIGKPDDKGNYHSQLFEVKEEKP